LDNEKNKHKHLNLGWNRAKDCFVKDNSYHHTLIKNFEDKILNYLLNEFLLLVMDYINSISPFLTSSTLINDSFIIGAIINNKSELSIFIEF